MRENLKKAILAEVKDDYALYSRIESLIDTAEKAEKEERDRILKEKEQDARNAIKGIGEFAKENRIIKP